MHYPAASQQAHLFFPPMCTNLSQSLHDAHLERGEGKQIYPSRCRIVMGVRSNPLVQTFQALQEFVEETNSRFKQHDKRISALENQVIALTEQNGEFGRHTELSWDAKG
jgi:hypothetical protein